MADTIAGSGGLMTVLSSGLGFGTEIRSGGLKVISAGGRDNAETISAGAEQDVFGRADLITIRASGLQIIETGGFSFEEELFGSEIISSGGLAQGVVVHNGATLTVLSGGSGLTTNIFSGGLGIVSAGGTGVHFLVRSGGEMDGLGGQSLGQWPALGGAAARWDRSRPRRFCCRGGHFLPRV